MKQNSILKNLILFGTLFLLSINTFAQTKNKINDKCLVILGAEHRYTQVANTKNATQIVIDNINSVIEEFDSDKIIYVYSIHKALYVSKKGLKMGLDSIGMIRDERLNLVNNNIITKKKVNAFIDKELIQFLQKNNTNDAVIVGFMADYYVKETLLGGKELGYDMYFIPEAIMGKSEKNKEKILNKMIKKGIKQLPINALTPIKFQNEL